MNLKNESICKLIRDRHYWENRELKRNLIITDRLFFVHAILPSIDTGIEDTTQFN